MMWLRNQLRQLSGCLTTILLFEFYLLLWLLSGLAVVLAYLAQWSLTVTQWWTNPIPEDDAWDRVFPDDKTLNPFDLTDHLKDNNHDAPPS